MRKIMVILGAIIFLLPGVVGIASSSDVTTRMLVNANDIQLNDDLKEMYNIRHDFGELGFTTELTEWQAGLLQRQGVEVEEVPIYHILKPPGGCEPWPECNKGGGNGNGAREYTPEDQTPWGIELMYNDPDIASTSGGADINVAVLDTGVDTDHLDLKNRVAQCKDFTGKGIKDGCSDRNGHGTHVAGTILADGGNDGLGIYGLAPEANLFAYRVCGSKWCKNDDIAAGIEHAADQGAHIISISIGGDTESGLIKDAIDYAVGKGCLVVAASGNDGPTMGSIDYPSANPKVIAVGAIDINENVPSWSSRGVNDGDFIIEEREVEFGAPGVDIESTWKNGGYHYLDGTSMATPHVSGLAAKLWQGNAADTRSYLQDRAKLHDLDGAGDDTATGFGLPTIP